MVLCEQCGSIRIVRARPETADRLVALFTSKRPFLCRRCGWRARRPWSDDDLTAVMNYGAGGAETDPDLAALDAEPKPSGRRSRRRGRQREHGESVTSAEPLDPATLALTRDGTAQATETTDGAGRISTRKRRSSRSRRKKSRRREIVAAIAVTALVMFLVVLLGLTGSCSSGL